MRKILLLITLGFLLLPLAAHAGIYGTLKGKVVDEEGKPVIGASVRVQGTTRGAVAKNDGSFTVLSINPGDYTVRVSAVGYATFEKKVTIKADVVAELNVKLSQQVSKTTEEIVIKARRDVENTEVGKIKNMDVKTIQNTAREGVTSIVGLSAGVMNAGNGYNIRGSRTSETQIKVAGLDIGNQFTGGTGNISTAFYPMVSAFATEQIQVITGSFAAEYGEALGGIVNTIPKSGKTDKYEGFLRWRTDASPLWGSSPNGLKIVGNPGDYKAIDDGPGYKYSGPNIHKIEAGFGGPLPLLDKSTFYISTIYQYQEYGSGYEIKDPLGFNINRVPNSSAQMKNITGTLDFALSNDISFQIGGWFGMTNGEGNSWYTMTANTPGSVQGLWTYGLPEYLGKQDVLNQTNASVYLRVKHTLNQESFYEFTISNTTNNEEEGRRNDPNGAGYFTGYNIMRPVDNLTASANELISGRDKIIDTYENVSLVTNTPDGYFLADLPQPNQLTGYVEGPGSTTGSNNPYGFPYAFDVHFNNGFTFRKGNYWQVDGNYNLSIEGQFRHMLKAGFDTRLYTISRHYNSSPWDGFSFFDIYTNEWGGNIYVMPDDFSSADINKGEQAAKEIVQLSSKPFHPYQVAAYLQDQITYKNIIINPGVRFDLFNSNAEYRTYTDRFVMLGADSGFANSTPKFQISPRLQVTYPITDRSNFSISYGMYFKHSELQHLYDGFNAIQLRGNTILGNPNMEPERSTQYSADYRNQITDDISFSVSAYYKDIYNQEGVTYIPAVPDPFYQYTVSEYGNARGLEFEIRKQATDHIGVTLNYTLSSSTGTSSSPESNYQLPFDPFTNTYGYPLSEFPQSWDRPHKVNFLLDFNWGEDEGPSIAGIHPIENTTINFTTVYQSGQPWTLVDKGGNAKVEYNSLRLPDYWTTDARLQRSFKLKDWFGESMGNSTIEVFADIFNLFNRTAPVSYYTQTGDPDDNGQNFLRTASDYGVANYYKDATYADADSYAPEQYNTYGQRLYGARADLDGNGITTPDERFKQIVNYWQLSGQNRGNYQVPRSVYVGIMVRF